MTLSLTKHRKDLYFDVYTSPSIKDEKRRTRGNINSKLTFSFGPGIKTPKDFFDLFKLNDIKKKNFWDFLSLNNTMMNMLSFWVTEYHIAQLIVNVKSFQQSVVWMCMNCMDSHLEAGTRVAFHAKHAD